jgi:multidrug efflux system membrane fusion protein
MVKQRPVVRGQPLGDRVQIVSGLAIGERVITEGADRLRDGSRVILPGEQPPAGGGFGGGGRRHRDGASGPAGAASAPASGAGPAGSPFTGASAAQAAPSPFSTASGAVETAAGNRPAGSAAMGGSSAAARWQNMSPEERAARAAEYQKLTPEQREARRRERQQAREAGAGPTNPQ